jgi:hypothetical protein
LTLAWGFEIALGIIGIALAGGAFASAVKAKGWRGAPRIAWDTLLHGSRIEAE